MFRARMFLIPILIACVAFVSCERVEQEMMDDAILPEAEMDTDPFAAIIESYTDWKYVQTLPAPPAEFTDPSDSGSAHGLGERTVYVNHSLKRPAGMEEGDSMMFPAGLAIVKEIMDDTNAFLWRIAVMLKTDDPAYADQAGWTYVQYQRDSETDPFVAVAGDGTERGSMGCQGCHAKAEHDHVFVTEHFQSESDMHMDPKDEKDPMDDMHGMDGMDGKDDMHGMDGMDGMDGKDDMDRMDGMDGKDDMDPMHEMGAADSFEKIVENYMDWKHVQALPAPPAEFTDPNDSGSAHGLGERTVYVNQPLMRRDDSMPFAPGLAIVKEIMDDANTFVWRLAVMLKTDDPMYADQAGWTYVQYQRDSEADPFVAVAGDGTERGSLGCQGCHAKAENDHVFVADHFAAAEDAKK